MPKRGISVLMEAVLVAVVGLAIGLAANATSGRGLRITKDYFPALPVAPLVPASIKVAGEVDASSPGEAHRTVDHERVVEIFQSESYLEECHILVDARDADHYAEGHIPGAYQLDHYRPEQYLAVLVPACEQAEMIILYCNGGECDDSELAAGDLLAEGVPADRLYIYLGGIVQWQADGLPFERGARLSDDLIYPDEEGQN